MQKIPSEIEFLIDFLEKNDFEGYLVGGCVRDMLLNKQPHDFDVATNATPEQTMSIFKKTVPTGIKHGTVTVIINEIPIEVTTYRTESEYTDHRRPQSISFVTSLEADLARRDFTVNAMAYNPKTGLVDCFDGRNDLNMGILRAVGNPEKRFCEDALRILRLFRFSSQLGFRCEEKTLSAAIKYADTLKHLSGERIFTELFKCTAGKNPAALSPLIKNRGLEFLGIAKEPDYSAIKALPKNELRLFALLRLSGADITAALERLRASNKIKEYCSVLEELTSRHVTSESTEIKRLLCKFSEAELSDALIYKKTVFGCDTAKAAEILKKIITNNEPYLISHLKITGNDLKALGFSGRETGKALSALQAAVIAEPQINQKQKLIEKLKNIGN